MKTIFQMSILIFFYLMAGAANAEDREEIVFKDWALHTDSAESAWILEQRVFLQGNDKTPLVHMGFQILDTREDSGPEDNRNTKKEKRLWITLRVPLGVKIAPGLHLQADEGVPMMIPLHHCRTDGCIALLPLQPAWRKQLEDSGRATVTYQLINGQNLGIPVSLMGVKKGLNELEKKMASGG